MTQGAAAAVMAGAALAAAGPAPTAPSAASESVVVGRSVEGRHIQAVRVGDPDSPRKALVVGSMHGDEPAGLAVVKALRAARIRDVDLWLVPTVNPDGLRRGRRTNAHGTDLNRNFPHRWRREGRGTRYSSGPRPLSEPESRAVRDLVLRLKPEVSIWYHQPWGHVVLPSRDDAIERRYARLARFPARRLRGRRAHLRGTVIEWQKDVVPGSSAFVVELPGGRAPRGTALRRHTRAALAVASG